MTSHSPRTLLRRTTAVVAGVTLAAFTLTAQAIQVTGSFTSWWGQPNQ
jgi:hypothetical protein